MGRTRKHAFSLVELLIVMSVLAMLLAIVIPSATRLPAIARRAVCAASLTNVGQAYAAFCSDLSGAKKIGPYAWPQVLWPYMGKGDRCYYCPEDGYPHYGMPDMTLNVTYFGAGNDGYHHPNSRPLFSRFPEWEAGSCRSPGPGIWKLNDQDFTTLDTNPEMKPAIDLLVQYTPGSNPNSYWLVIEEGLNNEEASSDLDYNDLYIHVEVLSGSRFRMTFQKQWYWANYQIVDEDGVQIGNPMASSLGQDGNNGPFEFDYIPNVSYGMNWRVSDIPRGVHKIVALDYRREAVHVGGNPEPLDDWETHAPRRHLGKLNVLFADGSVSTVAPEEIDPGPPDSENDRLYWDPKLR